MDLSVYKLAQHQMNAIYGSSLFIAIVSQGYLSWLPLLPCLTQFTPIPASKPLLAGKQ